MSKYLPKNLNNICASGNSSVNSKHKQKSGNETVCVCRKQKVPGRENKSKRGVGVMALYVRFHFGTS